MLPEKNKQTLNLKPALAVLLFAALCCAAACYGPNENTPAGTDITYNVFTAAGNNASVPLGQKVTIGAGVTNNIGSRQPNVRVNFTVIEGTADLSAAYSITDTAGIARIQVTPTYAPGQVLIQAQVYLTNTKTVFTITGT
jgi:hypothetical protein